VKDTVYDLQGYRVSLLHQREYEHIKAKEFNILLRRFRILNTNMQVSYDTDPQKSRKAILAMRNEILSLSYGLDWDMAPFYSLLLSGGSLFIGSPILTKERACVHSVKILMTAIHVMNQAPGLTLSPSSKREFALKINPYLFEACFAANQKLYDISNLRWGQDVFGLPAARLTLSENKYFYLKGDCSVCKLLSKSLLASSL